MAPQMNGLFAGFDLKSPTSLRQLVNALENHFKGVTKTNDPAILSLASDIKERYSFATTIQEIDKRIRKDAKFKETMESLRDACHFSDRVLIAVAEDLAPYAVDGVQHAGVMNSDGENTLVCEVQQHTTPPDSEDPYSITDQSKHGAVPQLSISFESARVRALSVDDDDEAENIESVMKTKILDAVNNSAALDSALPSGPKQLPSGTESTSEHRNLPDDPASSPARQRQVRHIPTKARAKHAPNLQRGYECFDDGTIDRSRPKIGEPDPTKFRIRLPSRKPDPKRPGEYKAGRGATYLFPSQEGFDKGGRIVPFDWMNRNHVKALDMWREQVFRRRLGGVRATRKPWLESEKHYLLQLIEEQLKRHHRPKWGKLANAFNRHFQGRTQHRGERMVFPGKKRDGGMLEEDRSSPWRTVSALEGQAFKWPEFAELLRKSDMAVQSADAVDKDEVLSSADEDEIHDPTPKQTEFKPHKYKPWKPQVPPTVVQNVEVQGTKRAVAASKRKHAEMSGEADKEPNVDKAGIKDSDSDELSDLDCLSDFDGC